MLIDRPDTGHRQTAGHAAELSKEVRPAEDIRQSRGPDTRYRDAMDVAQTLRPDEPLFCFSEAALDLQAQLFTEGFPGLVTYAVKANPSPQVIEALAHSGIHTFDVASPGEMALVRAASPDAVLHYHNPVKSRSEIDQALRTFGVRHFAIDDEAELGKLADLADRPQDIELAIRFRGIKNHAVCDFSTKFGVSPQGAAGLLEKADTLGFHTALTFHAGSQCLEPQAYVENIQTAAEISGTAGVAISRLNVGGGFPIVFPEHPVPPLQAFFEAISTTAADAFGHAGPELVCEPGRAMVAPSTSLLARVKHRRPNTGDLFLNDGIYGALMELTQVPVDLPCRVIRDGCVVDGPLRDFDVFGPTCDPIDRIPRQVALPSSVSEGDWIEIGLVGAYGAATATSFNGYGTIPSVQVENVLTA